LTRRAPIIFGSTVPAHIGYTKNMQWEKLIERNPEIMLGKPVFAGTRITVEFVLERLAQGATPEELVENYEGLRPEHIPAALAFAAATLRRDELVISA
jgi:uncharacterized protein (DUF433 family)